MKKKLKPNNARPDCVCCGDTKEVITLLADGRWMLLACPFCSNPARELGSRGGKVSPHP